jgi:hypothetical protein
MQPFGKPARKAHTKGYKLLSAVWLQLPIRFFASKTRRFALSLCARKGILIKGYRDSPGAELKSAEWLAQR